MIRRRGRAEPRELCSGPGKLTEALGIGLEHNGASLAAAPFELRARAGEWRTTEVATGPADRDQPGDRAARGASAPRAARYLSRPEPLAA